MAQPVLPRFCLIAPDSVKVSVQARFEPALATGLVEAVFLPAAPAPDEGAVDYGSALAALAAHHRAALLVVDNIEFAGKIGAGVVFTRTPDDLKPVRARLGNDAIVGIITAATRHDGMEAAQAGADFVGLGRYHAPAGQPELDDLAQLVAWWDDMIEIPSVAFGADTSEAAARLLEAGADTVALSPALWATREPAATLREIAGLAAPDAGLAAPDAGLAAPDK